MDGWKGRLERIARSQLRKRGLALVGYTPEDYVHLRRARVLAAQGVGLVLDVGANTGQYAGHLRAERYAGRIVSFEPAGAAFATLAAAAQGDSRWEARRCAVGATAGTLELRTYEDSRHNSGLAPSPGRPMPPVQSVESVPVVALDALRDDAWTPADAIALKIDVEGLEGAVLDGAADLLTCVRVVEIELSTIPLNDGQPLLPEIATRLYAAGLRLTSLRPIWTDPASGALVQADGIFERPTG
jgi:FkbM family methyltransferase